MNKIRFFAALVLAGSLSVAQASGLDQGKTSASGAKAARFVEVPVQQASGAGAALPATQWLILTGGMGLLGAATRRRLPA